MADEVLNKLDTINESIAHLNQGLGAELALMKYWNIYKFYYDVTGDAKTAFFGWSQLINDTTGYQHAKDNLIYNFKLTGLKLDELPSERIKDTSNIDELIKSINNSAKDDRNSFNMLVNTLKDTNSKEDLKELKSLTIATNDLLVKQVNSQNQANAISLIFSISLFACLGIGFCVKTFSKMF